MTLNKNEIMNNVRLPARLDVKAVCEVLNFPEHDIPVLINSKMLVPLGSPASNAPKYFACKTILEYADSPEWLSKATKVVSTYWLKKRNKTVTGTDNVKLIGKKKAKPVVEKPSTDSSTESSIIEQ